jgi:hypothetical protein
MADYEKMQRPWALLESKDAIIAQTTQNKDKLIVIFFNLK